MAEEPDIRDPSRRAILRIAGDAAAAKGTLLDAEDVPDVDVPEQFENIADTGIRESILAGAQGQFEQQRRQIEEDALATRRFRAGSTSERELDLARASRQQVVGDLGKFETEARGQILGALTSLGVAEVGAGAQADVAGTAATSAKTVADIRAKADTDVASVQKDTSIDVAEKNKQIAAIRAEADVQVANISKSANILVQSMRSSTDEILADTQAKSHEKVAGIQSLAASAVANINAAADLSVAQKQKAIADVNAASDLAVAKAQGENTVSAIKEQGTQERLNLTQENLDDIALAITQGEQTRLINEDLSDQELDAIRDRGRQTRMSNKPFIALDKRRVAIEEADSEAMRDIADRKRKMDDRLATFEMKSTEAQMTGLWEVYGPHEIDAFTVSFGLSTGEQGFAPEYDFDNSGTIDYADFVQFAKYAELGGIPTMDLKELSEVTRQFDIKSADDMSQFESQLDETARQFNLSEAQKKELALTVLQFNTGIAEAELDLEGVRTIVDLLDGPAALAFDNEDLGKMMDFVTDSVAGLDLFKSIVGEDQYESAKGSAADLRRMREQSASWDEKFLADGSIVTFQAAQDLIETMPTNPELVQFYLDTFDFDGDGEISAADAVLYELVN